MKADERKEAILECAKRLFSRQGYYQTHISDIIKEAQIARGTVYQYFNNKDDIFVTLVENFLDSWVSMISFEIAKIDLETISAKSFFRHRIKQTLIFLSKDADLCNIALRVGLGLPEKVSIMIDRFEQRIVDLIAEDLKYGQKNGRIRESINVETTATALTGALLRTSYYYFVTKKKRKPYAAKEIDTITEDFIDIFISGMFTPKTD